MKRPTKSIKYLEQKKIYGVNRILKYIKYLEAKLNPKCTCERCTVMKLESYYD